MSTLTKVTEVDAKVSENILQMLEFYKASFELSEIPRLVLDNGKIVKFNPKALELLEADVPFKVGLHEICEFVIPSDRQLCKSLIEEKGSNTCLVQMKTVKGRVFPAHLTFSSVYLSGRPHIFVTINDLVSMLLNSEIENGGLKVSKNW